MKIWENLKKLFSTEKCPTCGVRIGVNEDRCETCAEVENNRRTFSF